MTDLIVVFRVDNPSKNVAGHFLLQRLPDGTKIALRIVDLGHNVTHDVDHRVIPLAVEFEASWARLQRNIARALQIFGDGNLARLPRVGVAVGKIDFSKQLRSFVIRDASRTERANINRIVEPQSIDAVLAEQQQRVIDDVLPHLRPAIVRAWTEARVGAVTAIQINSAGNFRESKTAKLFQQ